MKRKIIYKIKKILNMKYNQINYQRDTADLTERSRTLLNMEPRSDPWNMASDWLTCFNPNPNPVFIGY